MRRLVQLTAIGFIAGASFSPLSGFAETSNSSSYKVLAAEGKGLNVSAVESLISKGDRSISRGDLVEARKYYDQARDLSKRLLSFYRDISGSFRGLDARIPREMDEKGRASLQSLAKANLRLATLFRRQNEPEVAVPLLIEVVRLMPAKKQGQDAYQTLLELGFADTEYRGGASR